MEKTFTKDRLIAISDGVYAILMTLLVLNLDISKISETAKTSGINKALLDLIPEFWGFALAFVLIAIFWITHYKQYNHLQNTNEQLIWINILALLFTTLIPFSTSLMTEYDLTTSYIFFQINILIIGLINLYQWHYIVKSKLLKENIKQKTIKTIYYKNSLLPTVTAIIIILTLLGFPWSMAIFATIPLILSKFFKNKQKTTS